MTASEEPYELESAGRKDKLQQSNAADLDFDAAVYGIGSLKSAREARDRSDLMRLGKVPVLKRDFGLAAIVGFTCTVLITWEGLLITLNLGLENGGPGSILYGFIFVWLGTWCVYASLSELASMAPTSGGQYFWVNMLAPPAIRRFSSYIIGWLTLTGWQALVASTAYLSGTLIQGLITLTVPSYKPERWQGTLLFWAVLAFALSINVAARKLLPRFESVILILHILGFFAILIPIVILSPHRDASEVFGLFTNEGGWPTQGLAFMIGLSMSVFCFTGVDGAIHMSEEIKGASVIVPRSVMMSMALNGLLGFTMLVAVLFCTRSFDDALASPTDYAFMEILQTATNSTAGAAALASIVTVMQICAVVADLASTSRMYWSFCRDRGVPGWKFFVKLNPRTKTPVRGIMLTVFISVLLSLITFGSSTAFNALVSLTIAGFYMSYLAPAALLLYRRCTGAIQPYDATSPKLTSNTSYDNLVWGPWRIPGFLGIAVNLIACLYMIVMLFFSFWPPARHVTADNMNYSCLVTGAVLIFAVLYYIIHGRKEYTGPVMEIHKA